MTCDEVSFLTTVLVQCINSGLKFPLMIRDEVTYLTIVLVQCINSELEFL